MSNQQPTENYGKTHFMRRSEAEKKLGLHARHLTQSGQYLPRLVLETGFTLFPTSYLTALEELRDSSTKTFGAILFKNFAQLGKAQDIATEAKKSYDLEFTARLKELSTKQEAITAVGIVSLTGVTQSSVSGWVAQKRLDPYTEAGRPHPRTNGIEFHFLASDFQNFCQWVFPK